MSKPQAPIEAQALIVREARVDELIELRHALLRPGLPRREAQFDGDQAADTHHFGAFAGSGNIGCVSYMRTALENEPAWQLRGMATRADWQGRGVGRRLLEHAEQRLVELSPIRQMWCNARIEAAAFYTRLGWQMVSDVFEVEGVGPHYRMAKRLG